MLAYQSTRLTESYRTVGPSALHQPPLAGVVPENRIGHISPVPVRWALVVPFFLVGLGVADSTGPVPLVRPTATGAPPLGPKLRPALALCNHLTGPGRWRTPTRHYFKIPLQDRYILCSLQNPYQICDARAGCLLPSSSSVQIHAPVSATWWWLLRGEHRE